VKRYVVALRPDADGAPRAEIEAASPLDAAAKVAERWQAEEVLWVAERIESAADPIECVSQRPARGQARPRRLTRRWALFGEPSLASEGESR
jgi:hypothetical protein